MLEWTFYCLKNKSTSWYLKLNAKAMGIVRVFSQEHEGKMVAGKNKDVSPLLCSASSINQ